jgi:cytochrome P450
MKLPSGPRSALWLMFRYLRNPEAVLPPLATRFGDPFTLPSFGGPIVVTGSPEGVRAIFAADPDTFSPFGTEAATPILGTGSILLQSGAAHRRSRKLMQPPFHGARMRAYGSSIADVARRHLQSARGGLDVEELFRHISLEVILRTVFGVAEAARVEVGRGAVISTLRSFGPLLAMFAAFRRRWFPPWRRFQRLLGDVHALLRREIADRRERSDGSDICALLVGARDDEGQPMAEEEMVEQLFTMVVAGHETTATSLAWAVDELWRDPPLLQEVRERLAATDGDPERLAGDELLDAICTETLRMRPLVPLVSRRLQRPFTLLGHELPVGVGVAASPMLAHRRPEVFPDPERFLPRRFLAQRNYSPHEYFPWGGGARRCLGAALAGFEMRIVLGTLILGPRLELTRKRAALAARAATVGPRGGVRVRIS